MSVGKIGSSAPGRLAPSRTRHGARLGELLRRMREIAMRNASPTPSQGSALGGDRIHASQQPKPAQGHRAHAASTNPSISAEPGRPNSGWSTENVNKSNELAHFDPAATRRVGAASETQKTPHGRRAEGSHAAADALPDIAAGNGRQTTKPQPADAVDRMVRNAPIGHAAQSAQTGRRRPGELTTHRRDDGAQAKADQGDVQVTIPAEKARQLGLIGPKEKPHDVTTTVPKDVARSLGLSVPQTSAPSQAPKSETSNRKLF